MHSGQRWPLAIRRAPQQARRPARACAAGAHWQQDGAARRAAHLPHDEECAHHQEAQQRQQVQQLHRRLQAVRQAVHCRRGAHAQRQQRLAGRRGRAQVLRSRHRQQQLCARGGHAGRGRAAGSPALPARSPDRTAACTPCDGVSTAPEPDEEDSAIALYLCGHHGTP